jgi:hypothetical protein
LAISISFAPPLRAISTGKQKEHDACENNRDGPYNHGKPPHGHGQNSRIACARAIVVLVQRVGSDVEVHQHRQAAANVLLRGQKLSRTKPRLALPTSSLWPWPGHPWRSGRHSPMARGRRAASAAHQVKESRPLCQQMAHPVSGGCREGGRLTAPKRTLARHRPSCL